MPRGTMASPLSWLSIDNLLRPDIALWIVDEPVMAGRLGLLRQLPGLLVAEPLILDERVCYTPALLQVLHAPDDASTSTA